MTPQDTISEQIDELYKNEHGITIIPSKKAINQLILKARINELKKVKGYDFTDDIETEEVRIYQSRIDTHLSYMIRKLEAEGE